MNAKGVVNGRRRKNVTRKSFGAGAGDIDGPENLRHGNERDQEPPAGHAGGLEQGNELEDRHPYQDVAGSFALEANQMAAITEEKVERENDGQCRVDDRLGHLNVRLRNVAQPGSCNGFIFSLNPASSRANTAMRLVPSMLKPVFSF